MSTALANYATRNCKALYQLRIAPIGDDIGNLELCRTLEEHGHNITELHLDGHFEDHLLEMPTVLDRLTSLTLSGDNSIRESDPASDVMHTLAKHCTNLRHLNLEDFCELYFERNDDIHGLHRDDLEVLLFGLKASLVSLKLNDFFDVRRDAVQIEHSPFIHCNLLEKLWLTHGATAEDMKAIGRLKNLKELNIFKFWPIDPITDEDYEEAFEQKQMNSLQQFDMMGALNFGKKAVMALLKYCPNLIAWSCINLHKIEGLAEAVSDCGPYMLHLEKLKLSNCQLTRNSMMALASLCNLCELNISGCDELLSTHDYIEAFQQGNLVNLEVLTLMNCIKLDNMGLKTLLMGSSKLRVVNLHKLGDTASCANILADCGPHMLNLQKLELSIWNMKRNSIIVVASLRNLLELNIDECYGSISKRDYIETFDQGNLVNLEVLTLINCSKLDHMGFKAILKGNSKLRHVYLQGLQNVTDFADIFEGCNLEHLETFHVIGCLGFLDSDVEVLKRSCPKIWEIVHKEHMY